MHQNNEGNVVGGKKKKKKNVPQHGKTLPKLLSGDGFGATAYLCFSLFLYVYIYIYIYI